MSVSWLCYSSDWSHSVRLTVYNFHISGPPTTTTSTTTGNDLSIYLWNTACVSVRASVCSENECHPKGILIKYSLTAQFNILSQWGGSVTKRVTIWNSVRLPAEGMGWGFSWIMFLIVTVWSKMWSERISYPTPSPRPTGKLTVSLNPQTVKQ